MSIWAKLKGALFEEEEYEVEEELVERKRKSRKTKKTDDEVKVAKKIDLPEQQKTKREIEDDFIEEETYSSRIEKEQKFNIEFDESDFQETIKDEIPKRAELPSWKDAPSEDDSSVPYEGNKERQIFQPTPIISPIYGILDKNYKKEDVVSKTELRLSTTSSRRPTLEKVREKAYGDLTDDFEEEFETLKDLANRENEDLDDVKESKEKKETSEKTVIDLNKGDAPAVESVTVGDAEEYFDELGLEYNVDYKDDSVEKTKVKRRSEKKTEVKKEEPKEKEVIEKVVETEEDNGDNLFDLIEAMYEDEEDL